jgi:hypothetical protein
MPQEAAGKDFGSGARGRRRRGPYLLGMGRKRRLKDKARRAERVRVEDARRRRRVEEAEAFQARVVEGERRGCLYCRRSDGGFMGLEHPLGESLGNTELVLLNGVVCDRCNGGVLSGLDQALADFWPVKARRTSLGVLTKAGKVPETRFATGVLRWYEERGAAFIDLNDEKKLRKLARGQAGPVPVNLRGVTGGRRMTARYRSELSRSLLKAAFGCSWHTHGEALLEPEWDSVRETVLGEPRDGYIVIAREGDQEHVIPEMWTMPTDLADGRKGMTVVAKLYGIGIFTDSFNATPPAPLPDEHYVVATFTAQETARRGRAA